MGALERLARAIVAEQTQLNEIMLLEAEEKAVLGHRLEPIAEALEAPAHHRPSLAPH